MKNTKLIRLAVGMLIAVCLAMFTLGGLGATAYAAQDALPGDALYAVKTGIEQSRIALTSGAINQARLNIQFADRRLDEMLKLAEQERYEDLGTAVAEFRAYTGNAIDALGAIAIATGPVQAREMSTLVAGVLTRQSLALNQLAASLPENAQPMLQKALATTEGASQTAANGEGSSGSGLQYEGTVESITDTAWVIDGVTYAVDSMTMIEGSIQVGDPVEFYVFSASDGTQTLWKVELSSGSDGMGENNDDAMESPEQDDSLDDDSMEDHGSSGIVEAISDSAWTIDGVTYQLDSSTKIEGAIQVGNSVEFYVTTAADGSLVLTSIELRSQDDHSGDSLDDMEDDSYDDNYQNGGMYSDDDHEYNSQPGDATPYYDSEDDDQEGDHSGQYYDDHQDDHEGDRNQNSGSGDHSGEHDDGDHGDHDD